MSYVNIDSVPNPIPSYGFHYPPTMDLEELEELTNRLKSYKPSTILTSKDAITTVPDDSKQLQNFVLHQHGNYNKSEIATFLQSIIGLLEDDKEYHFNIDVHRI